MKTNSEILKDFVRTQNRADVVFASRNSDGTRCYHVVCVYEFDRAKLQKRLADLAAVHGWTVEPSWDGNLAVTFRESGDSDEERAARMTVTRTIRVYGAAGHRQRESFRASYDFALANSEIPCAFSVRNSDKTGTNAYSELVISSVSAEQIEHNLFAQVDDGIFENSRVGKIAEIIDGEEIIIYNDVY